VHRAAADRAAARSAVFGVPVTQRAHAWGGPAYGRPSMHDERGQATIEWMGLVAMAALVLAALAAFRAPQQDRELGAGLAKRITCAAGGTCAERRAGLLRHGGGAVAPVARALPRAKAVDALRRLRGVGQLTKRIWIACLGYRRFIYERDHPRAPTDAMPVGEALEIANVCLNPLSFLEDD
jgi:hypothetical protein